MLSLSVIAGGSRGCRFFRYIVSRGRMSRVPILPDLGLEPARPSAGIFMTVVLVGPVMPTIIRVLVYVVTMIIPPPIDALDIVRIRAVRRLCGCRRSNGQRQNRTA